MSKRQPPQVCLRPDVHLAMRLRAVVLGESLMDFASRAIEAELKRTEKQAEKALAELKGAAK